MTPTDRASALDLAETLMAQILLLGDADCATELMATAVELADLLTPERSRNRVR